MKLNGKHLVLIVLVIVFVSGCQGISHPVILISKEYKPQIRSWLEAVESDFEFINHPLSGPIVRRFIDAVRHYHEQAIVSWPDLH